MRLLALFFKRHIGIFNFDKGENMVKEIKKMTREDLKPLLKQMIEIRAFENKVSELLQKDIIKGASHLYAGQEAVAVGAMYCITGNDYITSTHRGHGHCHAHGDRLAGSETEKQEHLNKMMAELCGRATGYCKGKGGSMHIADVAKGNLGATGIVGGHLPVATGAALSVKLKNENKVVLCFFGDGATNTGSFYESVNMASIYNLPLVFICENNLYGMSVPYKKASRLPPFEKAKAFGIKTMRIEGMDILSVIENVSKAVEECRKGEGPIFIEALTYRYFGHSINDPRVYRTKEEEKLWRERDPIIKFKSYLSENGFMSEDEFNLLHEEVNKKIETATDFALNKSPYPEKEELFSDVYSELNLGAPEIKKEKELSLKVKNSEIKREIFYWEALNEAINEAMEKDSSVFCIGEDVGIYGGAYRVTKGLYEKYPDRILDTPISEAAIAGACIGAAMTGSRPVGEIMYIDFSTLAMDQLVNHAAKNRYMFGGKTIVPMVMRSEGGTGRSVAAHHSQSLESMFLHFPGIYVVMPATPYDAKGLLNTAIRDNNPVMFIEHKMLYSTKGPVPEEEYYIPLGVADIKKEGKNLTIITYSRMVLYCLEAAGILESEGIDVEVIDLRSLKPLDTETICSSVKKTGKAVIVTEAYKTLNFASEIAMLLNENVFDWLDAPVMRITSEDVPVPMSSFLEKECVPSVEKIIERIKREMF
jgi:2-oxoisovalerate dehydrogenase E1 component